MEQESMAALKTALRVLTAISERHEPDQSDLEELRRYLPLLSQAPIDEVACEVIQQSMRIRARIRSAVGGL
jgi:hypothetical protein